MNEIDEIRWQMAQIRRDLHRDVKEVVGSAEKATDWRTYVRDQPWLATGAAFVMGYLLVPQSTRTPSVIVASATNGNHSRSSPTLVSATAPEASPPRASFPAIRWLFNLVRPVAMQAAQAYASVWIEDLLNRNHPSMRERPAAYGPVPGNGPGTGVFKTPPR